MNKSVLYVAVFGVLCVIAGVLVGAGIVRKTMLPCPEQGRPPFAQRAERFVMPGGGDRERGFDPLEILTRELQLSPEQATKVRAIMDKAREEVNKTGTQLRQSIDEIKKKSDVLIMEVLTPEQQTKFRELLREMETRCRLRGPQGDRGPSEGFGPPPMGEPPQR